MRFQTMSKFCNKLFDSNSDWFDLIRVPDTNDYHITSDEPTLNINCADTSQLDVTETTEGKEDSTKPVCSMDIDEDSSLSDKHEDYLNEIITEGKCQSFLPHFDKKILQKKG